MTKAQAAKAVREMQSRIDVAQRAYTRARIAHRGTYDTPGPTLDAMRQAWDTLQAAVAEAKVLATSIPLTIGTVKVVADPEYAGIELETADAKRAKHARDDKWRRWSDSKY